MGNGVAAARAMQLGTLDALAAQVWRLRPRRGLQQRKLYLWHLLTQWCWVHRLRRLTGRLQRRKAFALLRCSRSPACCQATQSCLCDHVHRPRPGPLMLLRSSVVACNWRCTAAAPHALLRTWLREGRPGPRATPSGSGARRTGVGRLHVSRRTPAFADQMICNHASVSTAFTNLHQNNGILHAGTCNCTLGPESPAN